MKLITLLFTMLIATSLFSQIPNNSFELWEPQYFWESPVNWMTNNFNSESVTKVGSLTNGEFAMKVETGEVTIEGDGPGIAFSTFTSDIAFNILQLDYRIDSIKMGGSVEIIITQSDGDNNQQIGYWTSDIVTSGIENLQIPINPISMESVEIGIRANSILTPVGYEGHAEIIVDNMMLGLSTSIEEETLHTLNIYPNPSQRIINFSKDMNNCRYQLHDVKGVMVGSGIIKHNSLNIDHAGIYFLRLNIDDKWIVRKVVIEK